MPTQWFGARQWLRARSPVKCPDRGLTSDRSGQFGQVQRVQQGEPRGDDPFGKGWRPDIGS